VRIRSSGFATQGLANWGPARIMNSSRANIEDRERIYLALLCQGLLNDALRAEFEDLLARRSWESADHRAVFEALAGWHAECDAIRASLPARLTRLGFPDTDIEAYFAPAGVSVATALVWLRAEPDSRPTGDAGLGPAERDLRAAAKLE
jgi:hypothetical protein